MEELRVQQTRLSSGLGQDFCILHQSPDCCIWGSNPQWTPGPSFLKEEIQVHQLVWMRVQPRDLENKNVAQLEVVVHIYHVSTDIHLQGS